MQKILDFWIRISTKKLLYILLTAWVALFVILLAYPKGIMHLYVSGENIVPDLMFYYSSTELGNLIEHWGEKGIQEYLNFLKFDIPYAILYGMLLSVMITRAKGYMLFKAAPLVPFVAVIFDFLENFFLTRHFTLYTKPYEDVASVAASMSNLKWLFILASLFIIFYGLLMRNRKEEPLLETDE